MAPSFHGRFTPGVLKDPDKPLALVIHAPARAAGLIIRIWELDTFVGSNGKTVREGTEDDLLAEIEGDLAPGPSKKQSAPDWRVFTVTRVAITSDDPALVAFKLQLPGDKGDPLRIPILSEKGEVEGRTFELGFSLHVGGAEKFRTKSPSLFTPPLVFPHVTRELVLGDGLVERDRLRLRRACLGVATGEGREARLDVIACGRVDLQGRLVVDETGQPIGLRQGRALYAFFHEAEVKIDKGPSDIPLALCDPLTDDGEIVHRSFPDIDPWICRPLELYRGRGDDGRPSYRSLAEAPKAAASRLNDLRLAEEGL